MNYSQCTKHEVGWDSEIKYLTATNIQINYMFAVLHQVHYTYICYPEIHTPKFINSDQILN